VKSASIGSGLHLGHTEVMKDPTVSSVVRARQALEATTRGCFDRGWGKQTAYVLMTFVEALRAAASSPRFTGSGRGIRRTVPSMCPDRGAAGVRAA
jgi:hypothetical protein